MKKKRRRYFDILVGAQEYGQKYEHWLEERLVLHFNDVNFVNHAKKLDLIKPI